MGKGLAAVTAWIGLSLCSMGYTQMNWPRPQVVYEPTDLAALLQREGPAGPRFVIVDVRPKSAYREGHLKDAVWLDLAEWVAAARTKDNGLDQATVWYDRIGRLGIGPHDNIVVYDDGRMTEAARVWFILQHFGVGRAAVLNGGYPAARPVVSPTLIVTGEPREPPKPVPFRPASKAKGWVQLADKTAVARSVETHSAQILDARTPAEYVGTERMKNPRVGHLPGAVNVSHEQLLDEHGKLKPPSKLRELFASAGIQRGQPVITHCQGGGRAALAALAAVYAGYGPVSNYYLSFGEWAADDRCPLVTSKPAVAK